MSRAFLDVHKNINKQPTNTRISESGPWCKQHTFVEERMAAFLTENDRNLVGNARHGNLENVRNLLSKGANVSAKDGSARTPLLLASEKGHVEVAKALLTNDKVDVISKR
ncbi:MAG UNVERIFIED_CONTAM: ankyrin repeat domain-containing protein [Anaerolineae bacterium]|jgi:predicted LPLAT superfamily acyltransferase